MLNRNENNTKCSIIANEEIFTCIAIVGINGTYPLLHQLSAIGLLIDTNACRFWAQKEIEFFIWKRLILMENKRSFGFKSSAEIPFKRVFADEDTSMRTCRSYSFLTTKSRAYAQKAINKNIKCGLIGAPASWTTSSVT